MNGANILPNIFELSGHSFTADRARSVQRCRRVGASGPFRSPDSIGGISPLTRQRITPAPALQPQGREPRGGKPLDLGIHAEIKADDEADLDIRYHGQCPSGVVLALRSPRASVTTGAQGAPAPPGVSLRRPISGSATTLNDRHRA